MAQGQCDGYQPSFWHNPKSGLCEPFIYGGCGGNANRYESREACLEACPGGGSNWGACKADSDCTLTNVGCCAACEPIADKDLLALNSAHLSEQIATRPCANVGACAPCPSVSVFVETGKYFRAVCVAGQCSALDVRQSPYTECSDGGGCTLRNGVDCCLNCMGDYVAVSANANFCPNGAEPCGKCSPVPPPSGLVAVCDAKRCMLEELLK
jgi:Kunitz/Bovine pancreatic trypsin inhibitor domain